MPSAGDDLDELIADRNAVAPGFALGVENGVKLRSLVFDLAQRRTAAGISQTEVAHRMGTSQSAITRLETTDTDIRLGTLARYAAVLGFAISVALEPAAATEHRQTA